MKNLLPLKIILTIVGLVLFSILAAGSFDSENSPTKTEEPGNKTTEPEEQIDVDLSKIEVKAEFQDIIDGKQKIVVYVTNTSKDQLFKGQVSVNIIGVQGSYKGHDILYVEDLAPGAKTFAIIWGKIGADRIQHKVEGTFTKLKIISPQEKYTLLYEWQGLNYITFYIKLDKKDKNYIINIVNSYRQKYPAGSLNGFQIYFYPPDYKGTKGTKPLIENYYANYACNYNNGYSELVIMGWDKNEIITI